MPVKMSDNGSILDIDNFDMRSISQRSNILIYGKKNSGKTTLMLNLLYYIHHVYPLGCAIAPTATVRLDLAKHMPSSLIWPEFDLVKLTAVVSKFTESTMPDWMENVNNKQTETKEADILNWLLLMDDVGYDENRFKHVTFKNLYMNGRQIGLGTILNLQKLKAIPPGLRGQLDYVFMFRDLSLKGQENINKEFFSFLPFATFRDLYLKCTEGFNCIVLDIARAQRIRDLGHTPKSLRDCIFVCVSRPIAELPPFDMFHKYIWKLDIAVKRLFKRRALAAQLKTTSSTIPQDLTNRSFHKPSNTNRPSTPILFRARVEPTPLPPDPPRTTPSHAQLAPSAPPRIHRQRPSQTPPQKLPPIQEASENQPAESDTVESPPKEVSKTVVMPSHTRYSGYPLSTFSSLRTIPTVKVIKPSHRQTTMENSRCNTNNMDRGTRAPACAGGTCPAPRRSLGFVPR